MTKRISKLLEQNIPQMVTFLETSVDLQPWERCANATLISPQESEMSLMPLMHMMMGHAAVSALFGSEILERYPDLIQILDEMDKGMHYFLWGLPAWFPWPGVMKSHIARYKLWQYLDDYEQALDNKLSSKPNESLWGDLEDVSDFIMARHRILKENGSENKEPASTGVCRMEPFEPTILTILDSLGFNNQHKFTSILVHPPHLFFTRIGRKSPG